MDTIFNVLAARMVIQRSNRCWFIDSHDSLICLANKYNGKLRIAILRSIRVISAGVRDADAEGVEGMSASKMKKAVLSNDFKTFHGFEELQIT